VPGLPCLSSNNSNEGVEDIAPAKVNLLTGGHKRSAFVLTWELLALAKEYGIERLGFLTLTFADLVLDLKEANRRFNSLNTGVIKGRYCRAVKVPERQRSRRLHFHLVVVLGADIRTGFDFEAIKRRDYRSANPRLRAEWAFWRKTAPEYGFGRTELLPVRSCAEALARYVGGYIGKNVRERVDGDKGARLVSYIGFGKTGRKGSCRFGWANDNGWLWRHKLAAFAARHGARDTDDLAKIYGPRWAYMLQSQILAERLDECYPSRICAEKGHALQAAAFDVRYAAKSQHDQGKTYLRTYHLAGGNKGVGRGPGTWPPEATR